MIAGMKRRWLILTLLMGLPVLAQQQQPMTTDSALDWLMDMSVPATQPATQPASPVSPFVQPKRQLGIPARLTLSDGTVLSGRVSTTPGKPIRVWDPQEKEYRDIPLHLIRSLTARVLWERQEDEWQFRESGSDIKVFTGQSYPARETEYAVELVNGQEVIGGIVAPLYLDCGKERRTVVLHKRAKGEIGQLLKDLVYVRRVELGDDVLESDVD